MSFQYTATSIGLYGLVFAMGCQGDPGSQDSGSTGGGASDSSGDAGESSQATTGASGSATGTPTGSTSTGSADSSSTAGAESTSTGGEVEPTTRGQWQPVASMTMPRQETSVVAADGRLFVLGGFVGAQVVDLVEVYDPEADAWAAGTPLPVPMHHINAAAVGRQIYITGFLQTLQFTPDARTFVFDLDTQTWSDGTPLPTGREVGASGVAVAQDRLYVFGGLQASQAVARAQYFDLSGELGWVPIADLPSPRDHMYGAAAGGEVFAVGGRSGSIGAHSTEVLRYDPNADAWVSVAPMPTSRGGMAGAVLGGWIFVAGGEGNAAEESGVFDVFEAYDPSADVWFTLDTMLTPRHGMGAATIDGRIYVPGGAIDEGFGPTDISEVWIPVGA